MKDEFFDKLKEKAESYAEAGGSHEFSHTQRVYDLAVTIAKSEGNVDMDVVKAAALLHDIARGKQDAGEVVCHAEGGADMAKEILEKTDFPKDKIDAVVSAIKIHRHSTGIEPKKIEEAIIQDADRLDAIGAITIGRMFSTGGKFRIPLHDPKIPRDRDGNGGYGATVINGFYGKILKITPETFKTKKAQEIAKERYNYVKGFVDRFEKEWEGKL